MQTIFQPIQDQEPPSKNALTLVSTPQEALSILDKILPKMNSPPVDTKRSPISSDLSFKPFVSPKQTHMIRSKYSSPAILPTIIRKKAESVEKPPECEDTLSGNDTESQGSYYPETKNNSHWADPNQKMLRGLSQGVSNSGHHFTVFRLDPDRKKIRKAKSKLRLSFSREIKSHKSTHGSISGQEDLTPANRSTCMRIKEAVEEDQRPERHFLATNSLFPTEEKLIESTKKAPKIRIKSKSPKLKKRIASLAHHSLPHTTKAANQSKAPLKINANTFFRPVFLTLQKKGDKDQLDDNRPPRQKKLDKRSSIFRGLGNFDPKNSFLERVSKAANERNKMQRKRTFRLEKLIGQELFRGFHLRQHHQNILVAPLSQHIIIRDEMKLINNRVTSLREGISDPRFLPFFSKLPLSAKQLLNGKLEELSVLLYCIVMLVLYKFKYDLDRIGLAQLGQKMLKINEIVTDEESAFADDLQIFCEVASLLHDCFDSYRILIEREGFKHVLGYQEAQQLMEYFLRARYDISEIQEGFNFHAAFTSRKDIWHSQQESKQLNKLDPRSCSLSPTRTLVESDAAAQLQMKKHSSQIQHRRKLSIRSNLSDMEENGADYNGGRKETKATHFPTLSSFAQKTQKDKLYRETVQRDSMILKHIRGDGGGSLLSSFQSAPALSKLSREIESALQPKKKFKRPAIAEVENKEKVGGSVSVQIEKVLNIGMELCSTKVKEVLNTFHESSYEKEQLNSDQSSFEAAPGNHNYFYTKEDSDSDNSDGVAPRLRRKCAGDSDTSSVVEKKEKKKKKEYFRDGVMIPASVVRNSGASSSLMKYNY